MTPTGIISDPLPSQTYASTNRGGGSTHPGAPEPKSRKAKSLAYLATEFVRLVRSQENETIDVLYAAGMLGVEKRRIYDITNALIGASVLQKLGKSSYKWIGGQVGNSNDDESASFASQRDAIEKQCAELDRLIRDFSAYLENTYYNNPNIVLSTEELVASCQQTENAQPHQTIIAVSAPPGTDVYVTNNERGRDNEIFLSSSGGEIRTYLLPSSTDTSQLYPPSIPNTPMSAPGNPTTLAPVAPPLTPQLAPTSGIVASTPPMDFNLSQADPSQMLELGGRVTRRLGFSNDYGLQDLFI